MTDLINWQFYPVLPLPLLAMLLLFFLWLNWRTVSRSSVPKRRAILFRGLRTAALFFLFWLLLQPERRITEEETELPALAVAVDASVSMNEKLGDNPRSRAENAKRFLESSEFDRQASDYRLFMFELHHQPRQTELSTDNLQFDQPGTDLYNGVHEITERLRHENLAAIVLLTDGLDDSEQGTSGRNFALPLLIPELEKEFDPEKEERPEDIYLARVNHPEKATAGWRTEIEAMIHRRGREQTELEAVLFRNGDEWERQNITFAENEVFQRVTFSVTPERTGRMRLTVDLELPEGVESRRSHQELVLDVQESRKKILYLEGIPRWEFRFLRRALQAEDKFELTALVRGTDGRYIAFDQREEGYVSIEISQLLKEGLNEYGMVILGNLDKSSLPDSMGEKLMEFVGEEGGGLLFLGGSNAYGTGGLLAIEELAAMAPATPEEGASLDEGRFQAEFAAAGRTHPVLRGFPGLIRTPHLLSLWRPMRPHPMATVLLETPAGEPAAATRRYGGGRVGAFYSDSFWRWQLAGDPLEEEEKSLYAALISRLTDWLMPGEGETPETDMPRLTTAKAEYDIGEEITVGALGFQPPEGNGDFAAAVTGPAEEISVPLALAEIGGDVGLSRRLTGWRGRFTPEKEGLHEIRALCPAGGGEAETVVFVRDPAAETVGLPIARRKLQRWAENSGGMFAAVDNWEKLWNGLEYVPRQRETVHEYTLWHSWTWLLLIIALLSIEWWLRRRSGLA